MAGKNGNGSYALTEVEIEIVKEYLEQQRNAEVQQAIADAFKRSMEVQGSTLIRLVSARVGLPADAIGTTHNLDPQTMQVVEADAE